MSLADWTAEMRMLEPSAVHVRPRGRRETGRSISFLIGAAPVVSISQMLAAAFIGNLNAARRRPSDDHARKPFVNASGVRLALTRPPRESANIRAMRPTDPVVCIGAPGSRYAITSDVGDQAGATADAVGSATGSARPPATGTLSR